MSIPTSETKILKILFVSYRIRINDFIMPSLSYNPSSWPPS